MQRKYELVMDDTIEVYGHILYHIRALKNFCNIKEGDLGGYIEKTNNLSHAGDCWVYDNACVWDNARVCGNARVYGNACVWNNARVCGNAHVYDNARVCGNARVYKNSEVHENAIIRGNARIYGNSEIFGHASIFDNAKIYSAFVHDNAYIHDNACVHNDVFVYGSVELFDNADIKQNTDYFVIKGPGRNAEFVVSFRCNDGFIKVKTWEFDGLLEEYEKMIKKMKTKYAKEYLAIVNLIKIHFSL